MSWSYVSHDFPTVSILKGPGRAYRIVFRNLENGSAAQRFMGGMLFAGSVLALPFILGHGRSYLEEEYGIPEWLDTAVALAAFAAPFIIYKLFMPYYKIARAIEVDPGNDRLRVLRKDRVEIERPLSRLHNLTIEDHPEAAMVREERVAKGGTKPLGEEKQHCLVGWFGTGGAEQVFLLYRVEWPNRRSLFEVRQAIVWAMQQATGSPAQQEEATAAPKAAGLNPPLD